MSGETMRLVRAIVRPDMGIVLLVVLTVMLMVLPLPPLVVDMLVATSMSMGILVLMVALYLKTPVEFSTLPAVILIATVFRLALSITTTRLILLEAEAGAIIATFGEFVIAGNVLVGLVVFLIITIVQFIVITKGAERVAEVGARFTLDALPGKQMSIDADLRNGDIDQAEARRRRRLLEKESSFFGAMDGAMKFVKGDAIAGLIIIFVNLIGGIAVGTLQHGMTMGQAVQVFSLLTVGDGLVSQIPALFVSITAGTVVTRVTSEASDTLGNEIGAQLIADPRALGYAAGVTLLLGLVPGFPFAIFLFLAALLGGIALMLARRTHADEAAVAADAAEAAGRAETLAPPSRFRLLLGPDLHAGLAQPALAASLAQGRERLMADLAIALPRIEVVIDAAQSADGWAVSVDDVPVTEGRLATAALLVTDDPEHLVLAGIAPAGEVTLPGQRASTQVDAAARVALDAAGIGYRTAEEALAAATTHVLAEYAPHFIGAAEARGFLQQHDAAEPELARELSKLLPPPRLAEVLRRLAEERVPLGHARALLETLVDWAPREQDTAALAERVRHALRRQICFRLADADRAIGAVVIEHEAEAALRGALRQGPAGAQLALPEAAARELIRRIRAETEGRRAGALGPVVLCATDLRRHLRGLLARHGILLPVIATAELAPEFTVQPIGTVRLGAPAPATAAPAPRAPATPRALPEAAE
jgi:type III secretion protein V